MRTLNKIYQDDWLNNQLPDHCAQLIIADPPYFEVKGDFDFIWNSMEDYLTDVEKWVQECKRVLAPNGTLFWYGHAKKIAYSQIIMDKYFRMINHIVWQKRECQTLRNEIAALRSYAPVKEHILMYENNSSKSYSDLIDDNPNLFIPIKRFFDDWLDSSGMTLKQVVSKLGSSCTHWFGFSTKQKAQFSFPSQDKWELMNSIHTFTQTYKDTRYSYEELRREYEVLRKAYLEDRRFFKLTKMQSDVFLFSQESHKTKLYDHDTKKPETMTRFIIMTTTRKDDLIVVPFSGSGTECAMAAEEGRRFIGFDIVEKNVRMGNDRCQRILSQPKLFHL